MRTLRELPAEFEDYRLLKFKNAAELFGDYSAAHFRRLIQRGDIDVEIVRVGRENLVRASSLLRAADKLRRARIGDQGTKAKRRDSAGRFDRANA
jgi:hypothetical protein